MRSYASTNDSEMRNLSDADLLTALCGTTGRLLAKRSLPELFGLTKPRQDTFFAGEERAVYVAHPQLAVAKELYVRALYADMKQSGIELNSPESTKAFLCGRLSGLEYEVFYCIFLDVRNHLICAEELFRGSLTQTSVYPREVVKAALAHNAAAVIFAHNHPSGHTTPSQADEVLTSNLKKALAMVDVKVLDHFVVGGNEATSFASRGLL